MNRSIIFAGSPNIHENCEVVTTEALELQSLHPQLISKICRALLCQRAEAFEATVEVIKFLHLVAKSDQGPLTPSHRVDLAWHEFILFTRAYQAFCESRFGKFIHHQPGVSHQDHRNDFEKTLRLYQESFGDPPKQFWGRLNEPDAACGTCESNGEE